MRGPRARHDETELPTLIGASAEHLGPVTRAGVDVSAWNSVPHPPGRRPPRRAPRPDPRRRRGAVITAAATTTSPC
ncbi:DUF5994 family protein [Streptomyces sp. NPDC007883]|uniref:DUF5994 family protein n=1 Tax=Streptomyces sp. NPDC007883 TaxID=3155116 RepID=UPI003405FDDB